MSKLPLILMIVALLAFLGVFAFSDNRKPRVLQWMLVAMVAMMIGSDMPLPKRELIAAAFVTIAAFGLWRANRTGGISHER